MPMKNPPHPGRSIKDGYRDALGLTIADAAQGLGVTRQQLYRVIKGDSAITPEMAFRLEKAIGGTADTWLRMQMNYDLAQVRARASSIVVRPLRTQGRLNLPINPSARPAPPAPAPRTPCTWCPARRRPRCPCGSRP